MSFHTRDDSDARPSTSPGADGGAEGWQAAARLLEMVATEVGAWRAEAEREAAAIVAAAHAEADQLVRAARTEADQVAQGARAEADQVVQGARAEAARVQEEITGIRERHDAQIAHLRQVEVDHRTRLRTHLTEMLERVDAADAPRT